jgi:hypothetical protein
MVKCERCKDECIPIYSFTGELKEWLCLKCGWKRCVYAEEIRTNKWRY